MAEEGPSVCIIHLGEQEFKGGIEEAIGYLLTHLKYHFTERGRPAKVSAGSILLFTLKGKLFCEAVASTDIHRTSQEDMAKLEEKFGREYPYCIDLDPRSIRIYPRFLTMEEVERIIGERRGRLFTYIKDPAKYLLLLRRIYAGPEG